MEIWIRVFCEYNPNAIDTTSKENNPQAIHTFEHTFVQAASALYHR